MRRFRCKQTQQIFMAVIVIEYPSGWSVREANGKIVWYDGRYFELLED